MNYVLIRQSYAVLIATTPKLKLFVAPVSRKQACTVNIYCHGVKLTVFPFPSLFHIQLPLTCQLVSRIVVSGYREKNPASSQVDCDCWFNGRSLLRIWWSQLESVLGVKVACSAHWWKSYDGRILLCQSFAPETDWRRQQSVAVWIHLPTRWSTGPHRTSRPGIAGDTCPDFIRKDRWPPNSPDLNPLDYHIWGAMLEKYPKFYHKPETITELMDALWLIWDDCPGADQQGDLELQKETPILRGCRRRTFRIFTMTEIWSLWFENS